ALAGLVHRIVRGADQSRGPVDVGNVLLLAPDVVAARDHVDAGSEELVRLRGHQSAAAGEVLAVGDDAVDGLPPAVLAEAVDDDRAAGLADHVPDRQNANLHSGGFLGSLLNETA